MAPFSLPGATVKSHAPLAHGTLGFHLADTMLTVGRGKKGNQRFWALELEEEDDEGGSLEA